MVVESFLLGISSASYCLLNCASSAVPMFLSEDDTLKKSLLRLGKFLSGRFLGYIIFGFIIGLFGAYSLGYLDPFINQKIDSWMMIILGIFLSVSGLSKKGKIKSCLLKRITTGKTLSIFITGFLTGISFCPPFLVAASRVFGLKGSIGGVIYFFFFFLGTSLYMLPLGGIYLFSKYKKVTEFISSILRVLIGFYFLIFLGLFSMISPGGA